MRSGRRTAPCSYSFRQSPLWSRTQAVLIDQQREQQRAEIGDLIGRLAKADRLREGLNHGRATATLHMLSSLESFVWLRRDYGLSLRQTRETLTELARTLLRD